MKTFRVAVVGCCHGELDIVYSTIRQKYNNQADLVLFTGDFEAMRNKQDLNTMACPPKYRAMHDFHRYYHGTKKAPILSIVIGGNHEASSYMQELKYGGWLAPNIYYLGNAGVINVGPGLRIAGISGIYEEHFYTKEHFEKLPYDQKSMRSVYYIRNDEIAKLKLLKRSPLDIMMTHDWPEGISKHGNESQLLRFKPYFKKDIASGRLGSRPGAQLMTELQPAYWFSSHLHVRFTATVDHSKTKTQNPDEIDLDFDDDDETKDSSIKPNGHKETKFLALDKPLPGRKFLEIVSIETQGSNKRSWNEEESISDLPIFYDPEWLAIQRMSLVQSEHDASHDSAENLDKKVDDELKWIEENIVAKGKLQIPYNFKATMPSNSKEDSKQPKPVDNEQTVEFLRLIQGN